jgi:alpha-tubulin suppressor-like RCC1 family protein
MPCLLDFGRRFWDDTEEFSMAPWMTGTTVLVLLAAVVPARPPTGDAAPGAQLSGVVAVAAGRGHSCAVVAGGTVYCWGGNNHGQLGDGGTGRRLNPVRVEGLAGVSVVRVGGDHSCALAGGAVYCWGANTAGQLGDGRTKDSAIPVRVAGLTAVTAIATGREHTCAATAAGALSCWGSNARGQLGDGTTTNRPAPVPVAGIGGVSDVAAGDAFHTCALAGGAAYCWGWDHLGQLGTGVQNDPFVADRHRTTPAKVVGLGAVTAVSVAGAANSCALSAGAVYCWGWNTFGQLGDGGHPPGDITGHRHSATPVQVTSLTGVAVIASASGTGQMCAVLADGAPRCWGHNGLGQVGDGSNRHQPTPVTPAGLGPVAAVTGGADHTCAITADDARLFCWRFNNEGQLGDGSTTSRTTPVPVRFADPVHSAKPLTVAGIARAVAVAAGGNHSCATVAGGTVWCWGDNGRAARVPGLSGVVAVTAGYDHTCALVTGGAVFCWGWNGYGQLGDGTYVDRTRPVRALSGAVAIAAGREHTCAALADSTVRCWGHNYTGGPLGVLSGSAGGAISEPLPVKVGTLTGAVGIAIHGGHTCALLDTGGVRCWGWGFDGQLGNGKPGAGPDPVPVSGLTGATAVTAGVDHSCAIVAGAGVSCWGANAYAQLGDGTTTNRYIPVTVPETTGATAISAGADHTCATLLAGAVRCWGDNTYGQLGDGSVRGAIGVSAGWGHTCALLANRTVHCWGHDDLHQLGSG